MAFNVAEKVNHRYAFPSVDIVELPERRLWVVFPKKGVDTGVLETFRNKLWPLMRLKDKNGKVVFYSFFGTPVYHKYKQYLDVISEEKVKAYLHDRTGAEQMELFKESQMQKITEPGRLRKMLKLRQQETTPKPPAVMKEETRYERKREKDWRKFLPAVSMAVRAAMEYRPQKITSQMRVAAAFVQQAGEAIPGGRDIMRQLYYKPHGGVPADQPPGGGFGEVRRWQKKMPIKSDPEKFDVMQKQVESPPEIKKVVAFL